MRKTKVWQVIWGLKDGGAETLAREYARLVDPEKFDATIITMYPFTDTANYRRAKEAGLRIQSIFKRRNTVTRAVRLLVGRWYVPFEVGRMLRREKPDTIHLNSQMADYLTSLKKRLSDTKLLYTCHAEVDKYFSDKEDAAVRKLIRDHDLRLIALHEDMRVELNRRFGKEDTVVIRNGVELNRFRQNGKAKNEVRKSVGIEQDAWVVGHVGRFSQVKNHAFLLKVFQEIVRRKSNAHLLLVGNGPLYEEVIREVNDRGLQEHVTILSHRTDIPDLLHAMDVMVFPSLYEGLSVTLVEAQASGLKCVISDNINPANLLSEQTIPVSLKETPAVWAEIALNSEFKNAEYGDIEEYNMNWEIHRLERLYQGESGV